MSTERMSDGFLSLISDIVAVVCNSTGIPHLEFDVADEEHLEEKPNHQMTLNLYPSQVILSKAYADIVQNFGWRKFTIVYDATDGETWDLVSSRSRTSIILSFCSESGCPSAGPPAAARTPQRRGARQEVH